MAKKKFGYGNFYCTVCGERVEKNMQNCPKCGASYGDDKYIGISQTGAGGIGYSSHSGDACFKAHKRKSTIAGFIFLLVLTVIAAACVMIFGKVTVDSDNFKIMLAVIGIIWAFDIIWAICSNMNKGDWEGIVESKKNYVKEDRDNDSDGNENIRYRHIYKVYFRTNSGKKKKMKDVDNSKNYDRFIEGERVKFIGKLRYYEKYDKTADSYIPCAACGSFRDARENYCGKCGSIMLKGEPVAMQNAPDLNCYANVETTAQGGKFCTNCGAQISANSNFCDNCGMKV